jgi:hypothetical protein
MTAAASGSSSLVAVLKPVKASIATASTVSRQAGSRSASQVLNACLERPSIMPSSREGPLPSWIPVRSATAVTHMSPSPVWRHTCSSIPMIFDAVERVRVLDQFPLALGQHGVVRGVPRDGQRFGDPGQGQVLHDQGLQRAGQTAA